MGGPKIALPLDQCKHIVNTYRRKYYAIKPGWDRCTTWIEHMANPDAEPIQYKCLEIGFEYIRLPNGMCLKYPDLRKAPHACGAPGDRLPCCDGQHRLPQLRHLPAARPSGHRGVPCARLGRPTRAEGVLSQEGVIAC